jgi:methylamine--corrinoid protein Co-methyltransferase
MKHRGRLHEILRRAETGPMIEERDFEFKLVTTTVKRLIEKYNILLDKKVIIPSDDDLSYRLFQAGLEFATEVGLLCQDTSRRIIWSKAELEDGLRSCPKEAILGSGNDSVILRARRPMDTIPPLISGGPYCVPAPEYLFVPMLYSYAKEGLIDTIDPPTLETAYRMEIKGASPTEALAAWREAELSLEVIRQAGRPGLSIGCVALSSTPYSELSATSYGGYRPCDRHYIGLLSEFKTNYHMLTKVVHTTRINGNMHAYYNAIYGGFLGGLEGVAIGIVAGAILLNQNYMGTTNGPNAEHPFLGCNTTPELLLAISSACQAITSNTGLILHMLARPAGGPGTRTMLLELAAFAITTQISGVALLACGQIATGKYSRHASGLDAKFFAEVAKAAIGLGREEANNLVNRITSLYVEDIKAKPIGKPFEEVYNLDTIEPKPEWQALYEEMKVELNAMGLHALK